MMPNRRWEVMSTDTTIFGIPDCISRMMLGWMVFPNNANPAAVDGTYIRRTTERKTRVPFDQRNGVLDACTVF